MKKILLGSLALATIALVTSCGNDKKEDTQNNATTTEQAQTPQNNDTQVYDVDVEGAETVTQDVDGQEQTDVITVDQITPEN